MTHFSMGHLLWKVKTRRHAQHLGLDASQSLENYLAKPINIWCYRPVWDNASNPSLYYCWSSMKIKLSLSSYILE